MKRLLHVGCGPQSKEVLPPLDWENSWEEVRIDIDPTVQPDIVDDIATLATVPAGHGHLLFSKHNIEHLETHQIPGCFANFRRVLDDKGFAIIRTPNLDQVARTILKYGPEHVVFNAKPGDELHPIRPLDMLYGDSSAIAKGNRFMAHRTGFTAATLKQKLYDTGFEHVMITVVEETHELIAVAVNRIEGNVFWAISGKEPPVQTA